MRPIFTDAVDTVAATLVAVAAWFTGLDKSRAEPARDQLASPADVAAHPFTVERSAAVADRWDVSARAARIAVGDPNALKISLPAWFADSLRTRARLYAVMGSDALQRWSVARVLGRTRMSLAALSISS
jgi:hypothetical protein